MKKRQIMVVTLLGCCGIGIFWGKRCDFAIWWPSSMLQPSKFKPMSFKLLCVIKNIQDTHSQSLTRNKYYFQVLTRIMHPTAFKPFQPRHLIGIKHHVAPAVGNPMPHPSVGGPQPSSSPMPQKQAGATWGTGCSMPQVGTIKAHLKKVPLQPWIIVSSCIRCMCHSLSIVLRCS